ncbi:hypothetical protein [Sporosarcina sp. Te-1]|uniref:hypothetical protein n=1 Tax=Sporosarcina sp. Te-1 TaxID=2818390 RepID=UPI001A9EA1E8|nr:hypothetical protein [Sporosarcina sp. Te-1]QTD42843.1 hypothetical protein J3U78_08800 [Sporosarcina sp. Te-1]
MYEGFDVWAFLSGLPLGLAIAGIILYFSWRKGKKERRYDERYTNVHRQAKSISWGTTSVAILVAWAIVIIVEGPGLAFFILSGLWAIHMISYGVGAAIASKQN